MSFSTEHIKIFYQECQSARQVVTEVVHVWLSAMGSTFSKMSVYDIRSGRANPQKKIKRNRGYVFLLPGQIVKSHQQQLHCI